MAYEKTEWKARQGSDLSRFSKEQETTRSVILRNEPNAVTQPGTPFNTINMNKIERGIYDAHEGIAEEAGVRETQIADINSKIPNQASETNKLADKDFVNSTVANLAAWFLTPDPAGEQQWLSLNALRAGPWYSGGTPKQPTQNDYAIFIDIDNTVWRALYSNDLWSPQYKVNDTPFTAAQLAALNSNITLVLVNKLNNPDKEPTQNSEGLVESGGVWDWFGAAVSTLKTSTKKVIGAINELFDTTVKTYNAEQSIHGIKTFTQIPILPSISPTTDNQAVRKKYVDDNISSAVGGDIKGTVNSGTGTDVGTPAHSTIMIWDIVQQIWNRIFALNNAKANDADVVKLLGNQSISGTKTFNTSPLIPSKSSAAGNNATIIATEAQVALKANDLQTLSAGSGVVTDTPAQTNQTLLTILQNIWNRLFAFNVVRRHHAGPTASSAASQTASSTSSIRFRLTRHGKVVVMDVLGGFTSGDTAFVNNNVQTTAGTYFGRIPVGYRPSAAVYGAQGAATTAPTGFAGFVISGFPGSALVGVVNVFGAAIVNSIRVQSADNNNTASVVQGITLSNPVSISAANRDNLRTQLTWITDDAMPASDSSLNTW